MIRRLSKQLLVQVIWHLVILKLLAFRAFSNKLVIVRKHAPARELSYKQLPFLILVFLMQASCGGGGEGLPGGGDEISPSTIRTVNVSWTANRETAVNTSGGGYKVYYSTRSGFNISDTDVTAIDVPYVSPPLTPTMIQLDLKSGQYYFRVAAYSALTPPWGENGNTSAPSEQVSLVVP